MQRQERLASLRRAALGPAGTARTVQAAAADGVRGNGGALPFAATIQESFGSHDVSGIRAHTGGASLDACAQMGAEAYATGRDVAFAGAPSLHTAAHEAAHVVQQRGGVWFSGGVGHSGDRWERHADQVAEAVVRGESAAPLLDQVADGGPASAVGSGPVVQRSARDLAAAEEVVARLADQAQLRRILLQCEQTRSDHENDQASRELELDLAGRQDWHVALGLAEISRLERLVAARLRRPSQPSQTPSTPAPAGPAAPAGGQATTTPASPAPTGAAESVRGRARRRLGHKFQVERNFGPLRCTEIDVRFEFSEALQSQVAGAENPDPGAAHRTTATGTSRDGRAQVELEQEFQSTASTVSNNIDSSFGLTLNGGAQQGSDGAYQTTGYLAIGGGTTFRNVPLVGRVDVAFPVRLIERRQGRIQFFQMLPKISIPITLNLGSGLTVQGAFEVEFRCEPNYEWFARQIARLASRTATTAATTAATSETLASAAGGSGGGEAAAAVNLAAEGAAAEAVGIVAFPLLVTAINIYFVLRAYEQGEEINQTAWRCQCYTAGFVEGFARAMRGVEQLTGAENYTQGVRAGGRAAAANRERLLAQGRTAAQIASVARNDTHLERQAFDSVRSTAIERSGYGTGRGRRVVEAAVDGYWRDPANARRR